MAWRGGGWLLDRRRRFCRPMRLVGLLFAVAFTAAGCSSAVVAWRSVNGTDINDPNPETAPFTGNMAKAYQQPYPNLASVPPPPTDETSTVERNKLTQTLIAQRSATAALGAPPPAAAAAPAAAAPARAGRLASNSPAPGMGNGAPTREQGEPPEAQPLNSSLVMPSIAVPLPQPQAPPPPPPNPTLASPPPGPPPAPLAPPSPAVASGFPEPAPPQPLLAPIAAQPGAAKPPAKPPPSAAIIATLDIAGSSASGAFDSAQLAHVAALYKAKPTTVRIVAFAAPPPPGVDPLALYHAALDRAQGVARALTADGVPASKIQTEATPSTGAQVGRIEIQFAP